LVRLAAIDLGTNTVRLLVVDADGPGAGVSEFGLREGIMVEALE